MSRAATDRKCPDVRQADRIDARPHLIAPPPCLAHGRGPVEDVCSLRALGRIAGLDIDDLKAPVGPREQEIWGMPSDGCPIAAPQPHRLRRDPGHRRVEVGQPQSIQFQATLVRHVSARVADQNSPE